MNWPWNQDWSQWQMPPVMFVLLIVVWLLVGYLLIWGGWPFEWKRLP